MYCQDCRKRKSCQQICKRLEAHLKTIEGYQNELPFDHSRLEHLSDTLQTTLAGLLPDYSGLWESITPLIADLPDDVINIFYRHYHDGISTRRLARRMGIHRVTVHRRLSIAITAIRRKMKIEDPKRAAGKDERSSSRRSRGH